MDHLSYRGNILTERYEGNTGTRIRGKILDVVLSENPAVKVIGTHTMASASSWRTDVKAGMSALLLKTQGKDDGIWASFERQNGREPGRERESQDLESSGGGGVIKK